MVTILRNSEDSLPTQPAEPQWWEGGHFPPLTLCECAQESPAASYGQFRVARAGSPFYQNLGQQLLLLVLLTGLCLGGYYLVSRFVATSVIVQGRSMLPTLQDGERFILNRLSYFRHRPERGDLVVVKDPGHTDYAVKR